MTAADGTMPEALQFDADWALFQAALDRADVTLIGRRTHEAAPNFKRRRRIVVTRAPAALDAASTEVALDPAVQDLRTFIAARHGAGAHVAVAGGTGVFDLAAARLGYDAFTLTVAPEVRLPGGRPVFAGAEDLHGLAARLARLGLARREVRPLDGAPGLRVEEWRREGREASRAPRRARGATRGCPATARGRSARHRRGRS